VHPTLSAFCTELTGITQTMVDVAAPLEPVMQRHAAWLESHGVALDALDPTTGASVLFVTCGDYDLKRSLPEDPNIDCSALPKCYSRWCNLKKAFAAHRGVKRTVGSMADLLGALRLPLEGHHHSGIDDCKNLAQAVRSMLAQGWKAAPTQREAVAAAAAELTLEQGSVPIS
jgi:ERI1 exoribonuclease 3